MRVILLGGHLRLALDVAAAGLGLVGLGPILPLAVQLPDLPLVALKKHGRVQKHGRFQAGVCLLDELSRIVENGEADGRCSKRL